MTYCTADILKGKKNGEGGGIGGYDTEQTRCLAAGERWHKAGIPDAFEGQRVAVVFNKVAGTENVKGSVAAAVAARIDECPQKRKIRKDAVRYLVARANMPDYSARSPEERDEWVRRVRGFFAEKYGEDNVVDVRWHFDQTTPHLHLTVVPITKDGRLAAKEVFKPTKANMRRWQKDWFVEVAAPMGYEEPDFGRSQEKGYTRECVASRRQAEAAKKKTMRVVASAARVEKSATERAMRAGKAATEAERRQAAAEAATAALTAERPLLEAEAAAARERTRAASEVAMAAEKRAIVATSRASEAERRLEHLRRAARLVAKRIERAKADALRGLRALARRCWGGASRPPMISNAARIAVNSNKSQVRRGNYGHKAYSADRARAEVRRSR